MTSHVHSQVHLRLTPLCELCVCVAVRPLAERPATDALPDSPPEGGKAEPESRTWRWGTVPSTEHAI